MIKQYDVVRVIAIPEPSVLAKAEPYQRAPRVGDCATVVELYTDPPGYELECSDSEGSTIWLGAFAPDDLVLDREWSLRPD